MELSILDYKNPNFLRQGGMQSSPENHKINLDEKQPDIKHFSSPNAKFS